MSDISAGTEQPAPPGADHFSPITAAPRRPARWRRAVVLLTGAAAVLAVFSAGVLYADLRSPHDTAAATTPSSPAPLPGSGRAPAPPAPTATVIVQAPRNVPVTTRSPAAVRGAPPVRIDIPALKINQRLVGLRVNANRQLDVPQSYNDVGWWSTGPVPGDPGAAVFVGHVDSTVGPAIFYRLSSLTKGAAIAVHRADGTTVTFRVTGSHSFSKKHFPDKLVYRTSGHPSLHLVTCGGSYDRRTGYRDNVVVFADLVRPAPKPAHKPAHKKSAHVRRHGKG